ncbi:DNA replication/repair protein RecF [Larsenimonas suaedae]|uniref:DNA replication and repair protein RecF n=1 Tax=Larsenimonas suaedae TaxID=1851019 RepID=A0ABU1GR62_9GAMM|nr:DNA replication/repair protein RecF [Larsenimonas suaedae]MCM2972689.1 DNA replication/repair protein RecF [Larsenimonas suaedae]MDR5894514.1 DNA replication/repair protein RecF [Larsenimonas suaedae]
MPLDQFRCTGLRNLAPIDITPSDHINLITGANGSGKTSVLEGLHILGMARSFRTHQLKHAIHHEADGLTVFGRLAGTVPVPLGVRRQRSGDGVELRVAGERVDRIATLAEKLPMQVINPDAFRLIEGAPASRREFLDWGVFHVNSEFFDLWRATRRALKHRNALLRHDRMDRQAIAVWSAELARWGQRLDQMRQEYIQAFRPVFERILAELVDLPGLQLRYYRGWDKARPLDDVLSQGIDTDRQMGFTQQGPQRADLRLRVGKYPAAQVLSRGQQKLVVSAMKLAQGHWLEEATGRQCIYLIDDLAAELDETHRQAFCGLLEQMTCQIFLTGIDRHLLDDVWRGPTDMAHFHISDGRLTAA